MNTKAILILEETPEDCVQCPCFIERNRYDGNEWHSACYQLRKEVSDYGKPKECPLKPIQKGHGRLGDLDALEQEMINGIKAGNYEEGYEEYGNINNMDDCVECVKYADTIIEADTGEEE